MAVQKPGKVYLVGAGPGDPKLLTLRGAQVLSSAQVVVHDQLLNPAVLRHAPQDAQIVAVRRTGDSRTDQEEVNRFLVEQARLGKSVVRLKGGDPYVFGRGGEEAEVLAAAGIPFEVVPGVSSFHAVPAAAGIPLTHRGLASAFTVVTGHEDPGKRDAAVNWKMVARTHGTKVILMGVERLETIAGELMEGGLTPDTPAALIHWGTTPRQRTVTGTLGDIARKARESELPAPAIAVVGEVVRLRETLCWFEAQPLFGQRIVVTRAKEQCAELNSRLSDLGAEVLEIPMLRIAPPTVREPMIEALAGLGEYDWIVFSSAQGVSAFFDALLMAFEDIRVLGNLRIAAVGPATAVRLKQLHLRVDAMPQQYVGRQIAAAIQEKESIENLRVLLARAQVANPALCKELEDLGAIVDDVAFYQTEPESAEETPASTSLVELGADWILFTSGSTVDFFHARFDLLNLIRRHPGIRVASIGPETSRRLADLGLKPAVEADPHTVDGLIQAVVAGTSAIHAVKPGRGA